MRRAQPGEKLVTLDGTERDLDPADLVIADHERAIGLAGVMGGENTEVSATTTSIVLETANFEPLTVIRSGERHRMRSEAQTRWEKGVDPEAAALSATYASQLLAELAGARWTGETELRADPAPATVIAYRPQYANATVGLEIAEDEQRERLGRLGFQVTDDWSVTVPTWRARDVRRDIDVVEEVGRFRLEDVPATLPRRQAMYGRLTHEQRLRRLVADVLVGAGMYEAYTYSLQHDDPDPNALALPEPLSSQQRVLRTNLADRVDRRGAAQPRCGERRRRAVRDRACLSAARPGARGALAPRRDRAGRLLPGARARRGGLRGAEHRAGVRRAPTWRTSWRSRATVQSGWVATYAPGVGPDGEWSAFELDLEELFALVPERVTYRDVITYPPLRQDLAFVVDEAVPAGDLIAAAREPRPATSYATRGSSPTIAATRSPPGKKSIAFSVAFQSAERTLSDDDAARLRAAIVSELQLALRRGAARLARTSERETNRLDARDLSIARRVTTKRPLVRKRGAGTQLRVATTHRFGVTVNRRTYASAPAFESRSTTVTPFAASSHTRKRA